MKTLYRILYYFIASVASQASVAQCSSDENCSKGFSCYERKCMVTWTDSLENLANNMTNEYIIDFEKGLKDDVGYNLYSLGSPLISDTQADHDVIPSTEDDRRSNIDDYVKEKFGNTVKAGLKSIVSNRISQFYTYYLAVMQSSNLSKSDIEDQAEGASYNLAQQVKFELDDFVHKEWEKWKNEQKGEIDRLAAENGVPISGLAKRFTISDSGNYRAIGVAEPMNIGSWFITIGEAAINLVKDGINMAMNIVDGISDFVVKLADGDFSGAFQALGRGFINAFNDAVNHVKNIFQGIWKGMLAFSDIVVAVAKALATMSPDQWACLVISLVMGIALSVIFTPLALGAFGIAATSWSVGAIAVSAYVEITIALTQFLVIDPLIDTAINGEASNSNSTKTESVERPREITFGNGQKGILDNKRNEYCYSDSSEYYCLNEKLEQICMISKDLAPMCNDEKGWYIDQDGVKSYYNSDSGSWSPPLNSIKVNGITLKLDKKQGKYCYDSKGKHLCLDESKKQFCFKNDGFHICSSKKGWYTQVDGDTYLLDESKNTWVLDS